MSDALFTCVVALGAAVVLEDHVLLLLAGICLLVGIEDIFHPLLTPLLTNCLLLLFDPLVLDLAETGIAMEPSCLEILDLRSILVQKDNRVRVLLDEVFKFVVLLFLS